MSFNSISFNISFLLIDTEIFAAYAGSCLFFKTSHLNSHGTTDIKPEMELHIINIIYMALPMRA